VSHTVNHTSGADLVGAPKSHPTDTLAPMPIVLDNPEDAKIVTLARATRVRTQATEGAAVRDVDGRTYTAATVDLPSVRISALTLAVAMAATSGAHGLEAVALAGPGGEPTAADLQAVRDLAGAGVMVICVDTAGIAQTVVRT
jgi:hypothetical protein